MSSNLTLTARLSEVLEALKVQELDFKTQYTNNFIRMKTPRSKQEEDFKNSVSLMKDYLNYYESGNIRMYLPMATELRKLLCEKLMVRIIPEVTLYKLHFTELFENSPNLLTGLQNFMPGRIKSNKDNPPIFELLFTGNKERMVPELWVNQIFFREGITIYELIKSVADKESAHSDKNYNNTLLHCKNWTINDLGCHVLGIYGISKFIYDFINSEYPSHI